jgi:aspartyl-tRNA(Asn)/glutamyl-tRNA(Gln) amidotransferase subunit B
MNLEAIIGLEIHVELKTKSKMFCSCANVSFQAFDEAQAEPNSSICPICMGYPGTLPVPNKTAIAWTQRAGAALGCQLARVSKFDRKHYFYPDLPKGYQISQYDEPFCGEGIFEIIVNGKTKAVGIERIHLEEDAAKNLHPSTSSGQARHTLVDFNRAGTPLMEIVTKPDLRSAEEAKVFLQELQKIMRTLGVSDADMEKGQMRCDANISLREVGTETLHPKTEIKNVNSFKFVAKALEYEIERQKQLWAEGKAPAQQSTRGYNSAANTTTEQRTKEAAADYRYFPEPDIPPFEFSEEDLRAVKIGMPELPLAKRTRLMDQLNVTDQQAQLLIEQPALADFYENAVSELLQLDNEQAAVTPQDIPELKHLAAKVVLRQLRAIWPETPRTSPDITPANFAELMVLVHQGKINQDAIEPVLQEMMRTGGDPDHIIQNLGLEQVGGEAELQAAVDEVLAANPDVVAKIKAGKQGSLQFLVGQVMKKTQGKANPTIVTKLLASRLDI